jgi:hypothetical protein
VGAVGESGSGGRKWERWAKVGAVKERAVVTTGVIFMSR